MKEVIENIENVEHLYQETKNSRGYMHPITTIGKKFLLFSNNHSPVLDMGCAYGNLVITAIKEGVKEVIACDLSQEHLDILKDNLSIDERKHLITIQGYLPNEFDLKSNSIAAIHASHILEYLNDQEIDKALEKFYFWLKPGGKLFIKCYSIHTKELANKKFEIEYQRRVDMNAPWPGYFSDIDEFSYLSEDTERFCKDEAFPKYLHRFDLPILVRALKKLKFDLEYADYMDGKENLAVKETLHDGREFIGIVAFKR